MLILIKPVAMATACSKSSMKKESDLKQATISKDEKNCLLYVEKGGLSGGYGIHLLKEELPPYLWIFVTCSNCGGILREGCGVGDAQAFMCLVCTQGRDSIVLKPNREAVASLTISCPLKSRGCGWEGKISESEPHLDKCGLFRVECQLSCGDVMERSDMSTHLTKNCPLREIHCEHCAVIHKEKETNIHQEKCSGFPLQCPNKCGIVVQRKNLNQHIDQLCQNTVLECPYREYGCVVKVTRKQMKQHMSGNRLIHLELKTDSLCGKLDVLQEENAFLKGEVSMLKQFSLFEGKLTFGITQEDFLTSKLTKGPFTIIIQKYSDLRNCSISITCCANKNNLLIQGDFNYPKELSQTHPRLHFEGCVVVVNQSDNTIHAKYDYSITFKSKHWSVRFLDLQQLAEIPIERILTPDIFVNDSIRVQLYYNMEK